VKLFQVTVDHFTTTGLRYFSLYLSWRCLH